MNNPDYTVTLTLKEWQRIEEVIKYSEPKIARRINASMTLAATNA
jgi:hypothetical protein